MSHETRPTHYFALGAAATLFLIVGSLLITPIESLLLKIAGITAVPLALVFMFAPFYYLKKYGQVESQKSVVHTTQVVDHGVYAIVRHPQYLGYMLLNVGLALINWHGVTAAAAALATLFFYAQAVQEEKYCHQQMGTAYKSYCRRVPRFNFLLGTWKWMKSHKESEERKE